MKKIILSSLIFLSIGGFSQEKVTVSNGKVTVSKSLTDRTNTLAPQNTIYRKSINSNHPVNHRCGSPEHEQALLADPVMQAARESAEQLTMQLAANPTGVRTVYSIPVVFHVIHKGEPVGTGTNISDAQIQSAIDALNRDYRRTNADGGIALGAGPADYEINFCLAQFNPSGQPTSGITRTDGGTISGSYDANGITSSNELNIKAATGWDPSEYLNVWVVSEIDNNGADVADPNAFPPNGFSGGTLGYAYLPTNPISFISDRDGIVILNCTVGNDPNQTQGYRLWFATLTNRALTHEVGHYLGLPHTFSDQSPSTCSDGDNIADTPPAAQGSTCSTPTCPGAIVENYMDYVSETCQNMFTLGQKNVMQAVLGGVRNDLTTTVNTCSPPVLTADFSGTPTTVVVGNSVNFTDLSTGNPTSWNWSFGGGGTPNTSTLQNPTITYSSVGMYDVTLIVGDGSGFDTITKTNYINVVNQPTSTGCDTLTNLLTSDNLSYFEDPNTWGYIPGHEGGLLKAYAEPFNAPVATTVQRVALYLFQTYAGSPNSTIDINVYSDNSSEPGTILGSQTVSISSLTAGFFNTIQFDNPVSVSGDYWVGVELDYSNGDTVVIGAAANRTGTNSSTYIQDNADNWGDFYTNLGLPTSLGMYVLTSASAPNISFTESATMIPTGGTITYDGSASTNYSLLTWYFQGGTPDTAYNISETVTYNNPGTFNVRLCMFGGCYVDCLDKQITVSNTTELYDNLFDKNIAVYPNPANSELNIQFSEELKGIFTLSILNIEGKLINSQQVITDENRSAKFDVSDYKKGVYHLRMEGQDHTLTKKIIIQ